MGHINTESLKFLLKENNIKYNNKDFSEFLKYKCLICLQAKANRNINKKSVNIKPYKILERVHSDLSGPINPKTYNNFEYYITFLDKKSKYLEVTLLKSKDNAYEAFLAYKEKAENALNNKRKIKEFFTDNGREYINKRFEITLNKYGIIHRITPPNTKKPNGFIERINLTLFNKVRTLLYTAKVLKYL
jgi:hypothetical protein